MKTDCIVFLGPSLSKEEAEAILPDALYLPPVRCGDILRILRLHPKRIAIIDGYFETTAAVWHKEILLALEKGIEVYGAASMGALRAAELAEFGMKGMGQIYEDYAKGLITADDEVCVLHRPEASGYEPLSDALVNIRATLNKALDENIIDLENKTILLNLAKQMHYKERSFDKLQIFVKFKAWLDQGNVVQQKALDAKALLQHLAETKREETPSSPKINTHASLFLRTLHFNVACRPFSSDHTELPANERIAFYARLLGNEYLLNQHLAYLLAVRDQIPKSIHPTEANLKRYAHHFSFLVRLTKEESNNPHLQAILLKMAECWNAVAWQIERKGLKPNLEALQSFSHHFRIERGLLTKDATYAWMKEANLSESEFEAMLKTLFCFDYFILKNNLDVLSIRINPEIWWLWEALSLTGSAAQASELMKKRVKLNLSNFGI